MLIGHVAPALAASALTRRPGLGPLVLASLLPDIALWLLVLAGIERVGIAPGLTVMSPLDLWDVRWTHSLVGTLGWAAGFTIAVKLMTRDARAAWIAGAVVASHWLLDLVVHAPDLTIAGAGTRYGWGLWDHPYLAMPLELLITFLAFVFYLERTRAADWRGRWAPVALAGTMLLVQFQQWLGPRPTVPMNRAPDSLAMSMLAVLTILTVLAWWTGDLRERRARRAPEPAAPDPATLPAD